MQLSAVRRILHGGVIADRQTVRLDLDVVVLDLDRWLRLDTASPSSGRPRRRSTDQHHGAGGSGQKKPSGSSWLGPTWVSSQAFISDPASHTSRMRETVRRVCNHLGAA